ncbi:MAG: glutamine--tRNA ligase/YqeY domain fusion protein [Myxococcales bacterium]|nr:glutamine--tRNA ligase/YqeY domain fusion protein [Myxococcales bacterium]MCB9753029.1 glutamine--tRNA ligase/YqeY domain fusion protein [Myxococcales bacterium]
MNASREDTDPGRDDATPPNFIKELVEQDVAAGVRGGQVVTRFPPEPNGYLHIGHAKSICLNFGTAELGAPGRCNLRFDDTNPSTEDTSYVEAIQRDVRWLGFDWGARALYASDYFEQLYAWAIQLIEAGKAYVDSQSEEEIREGRGNFYKPGVESPHRGRSVEENLDLFARMRAGEFKDGEHVLRAKIDMQSKDVKLRDPLMYRIRHVAHHRTGDAWPIYPMYDWAHGQSDAIEGVTHSLCTLEFQNHRPLYDWFLGALGLDPRPRQIEFARLNLGFMVMSKRKLLQLVQQGHVSGWDDPRMPTLAGMRRRGFTPEAIRSFCERIGVAKRDGVVDISLLEHELREDLNARSPRAMAVLRPLKVVIENYPEDQEDWFDVPVHPEYPERGTRRVPLTRELYVERDDYMEDPPRKWFRLGPGREVRLRGACLITCREAVRRENGELVELRCTWDPASRGGAAPDGRKVKGTLHWVSARHAVDAEVRLYDRLFSVENPLAHDDRPFTDFLNPDSLEVLRGCKLEPGLKDATPGEPQQFERLGYFCADSVDSRADALVFNRTIALRDSWAKLAKKLGVGGAAKSGGKRKG